MIPTLGKYIWSEFGIENSYNLIKIHPKIDLVNLFKLKY